MTSSTQNIKVGSMYEPAKSMLFEPAKALKAQPHHSAHGDHGKAPAPVAVAPDSLTIHESVKARVHYDGSGADYRNTVGMYVYDDKGNVTSTKILFADASYRGLAGGPSDFNLNLKAGQHIGFFIATNAAVQGNMAGLLKEGGSFHMVYAADGAAANVLTGKPMQLAYKAPNGTWSNVHTQFWTELYTTNTKSNADGFQHAKVTTDAKTGQMHVMFEDMQGGGNKDFFDGNFTIDIGRDNVQHLTHAHDHHGHHGHGFEAYAVSQHTNFEHYQLFS